MASLLEIKKIMADTYRDPGEPPNQDQAVLDAQELLGRIEAAILRRASFYLDAPANDTTPNKVLVKWAGRAAFDRENMARVALGLALSSPQPAVFNATPAQIFALDDPTVQAQINRVIPQLAEALIGS